MKKLIRYFKESYSELVHKVSWTPVKELQSLAITVMVASLIFAVVILAMDLSFENIMKVVYRYLAR
ncbi:MAG TPA: preprotein translocase subunit SecE [Candidatus Tidjanibacter gallistercoris]|nr:preprotein translocase subunit SecE [Candidatus Tidjanibacter gallistercoris]